MTDVLAISVAECATIAETLSYREAFKTSGDALEATPLDLPWRDVISRKGYDFVVRWETGGRVYYDQATTRS